MKKITKKDKKLYLPSFFKEQVLLIKSRLRFLCALSLLVYMIATIMSFIIIPRSFNSHEIYLWWFLVISSLSIFYLAGKAKTRFLVKLYGYIYVILLLYLAAKLSIIYPAYVRFSPVTYLFLLFLVSFSIPWNPGETFVLSFMHIFSYTLLFMHVSKYMPDPIQASFDVFYYFTGFIFLSLGFVLTFFVRRKEFNRDIENFILLQEVESINVQMQNELKLATRVHETLIPHSIATELVDIDIVYKPISYMSGDYAKFYFLDKDLLVFIICDVTGHGVSAALLVNRLHTEFERLVKEDKEPAHILDELNSFIMQEFAGISMYISAFCGLMDLQSMKIIYSNYGHPAQYLYNSEENLLKTMPSQATLLGVSEEHEETLQKILTIEHRDRVVLFTDGIIETRGLRSEEYGRSRLEDFIRANSSLSPKEFNQQLIKDLESFKKGPFLDDIFLINMMVK